jgi:ABC-type Fe3+/spermidine/putrescine transport system ATPase subunit
MLEIRDLAFRYGTSGFGLSDINLAAAVGTRIAIIGRSGCGKSTLIKLLGGHLLPATGSIFLNDKEITRLEPGTRGVSTVFQDLALFPHLTVYKNVEFPLTARRRSEHRRTAVEEYLTRFGIWERRNSKPLHLSGGEQQRTALARGLISNPSLLLLDEPTAALDSQQKAQLATFLNEMLQQESVPLVIVVTHDHEFAFSVCDYLAVMKDGRLIAQASTEELLNSPKSIEAARILDNFSIIPGSVNLDGTFHSADGSISFEIGQRIDDCKGQQCAALLRSDAVNLRETLEGMIEAKAVVSSVHLRGIYSRVRLSVGDQVILSDWFRGRGPKPVPGETLTFAFAAKDAQIVPTNDYESYSSAVDGKKGRDHEKDH